MPAIVGSFRLVKKKYPPATAAMTKTVTPTAAPAAIPTSTGCFGCKQLFPFPESIVGSKLEKNKI